MNIINVDGVLVNDDVKIEVKGNSKRVGSKSWLRYEGYLNSKSVGEYLENGGLKEDLRYDVKKGFVVLLEKYDSKKGIVKVEVKKV